MSPMANRNWLLISTGLTNQGDRSASKSPSVGDAFGYALNGGMDNRSFESALFSLQALHDLPSMRLSDHRRFMPLADVDALLKRGTTAVEDHLERMICHIDHPAGRNLLKDTFGLSPSSDATTLCQHDKNTQKISRLCLGGLLGEAIKEIKKIDLRKRPPYHQLVRNMFKYFGLFEVQMICAHAAARQIDSSFQYSEGYYSTVKTFTDNVDEIKRLMKRVERHIKGRDIINPDDPDFATFATLAENVKSSWENDYDVKDSEIELRVLDYLSSSKSQIDTVKGAVGELPRLFLKALLERKKPANEQDSAASSSISKVTDTKRKSTGAKGNNVSLLRVMSLLDASDQIGFACLRFVSHHSVLENNFVQVFDEEAKDHMKLFDIKEPRYDDIKLSHLFFIARSVYYQKDGWAKFAFFNGDKPRRRFVELEEADIEGRTYGAGTFKKSIFPLSSKRISMRTSVFETTLDDIQQYDILPDYRMMLTRTQIKAWYKGGSLAELRVSSRNSTRQVTGTVKKEHAPPNVARMPREK